MKPKSLIYVFAWNLYKYNNSSSLFSEALKTSYDMAKFGSYLDADQKELLYNFLISKGIKKGVANKLVDFAVKNALLSSLFNIFLIL